MNRRAFVEKVGMGSATLASVSALAGGPASAEAQDESHGHGHSRLDGPLATATVSFGTWLTDPPTDRFPNASPGAANGHGVIPREAKIKAGGSVNFVIAGLHQVIVYAPGTKPEDIDSATTTPTTGTPAGVPLIDDPEGRVYRGLDPSLQPRDRVEIVQFAKPGRYLVICGVQGHFLEGMIGYVRVLP
jgi:uncharacterized cupredoxin-like copper-binding protein